MQLIRMMNMSRKLQCNTVGIVRGPDGGHANEVSDQSVRISAHGTLNTSRFGRDSNEIEVKSLGLWFSRCSFEILRHPQGGVGGA